VIRSGRAILSKTSASVVLTVDHVDDDGIETGLKIRALWIWSKKDRADDQPDLVQRNRGLMADLLRAGGKELVGDLEALVEALKGIEFTAYVTLQIDRKTGEHWNEIDEVQVPEEGG
jgi:hypothetical protein